MNRIRDLRVASKMSQADLGSALGCHGTTVSKLELEQRQLDPATIDALCNIFGCTADYLLGRAPSPLPVISQEDAAVLQAYHALPLEIRKAVDGLLAPYRTVSEEKKDA